MFSTADGCDVASGARTTCPLLCLDVWVQNFFSSSQVLSLNPEADTRGRGDIGALRVVNGAKEPKEKFVNF